MCSTSCNKMKITAGIGSIDDYIPFAKAGADEVFCGYVPVEWMEKAGMANPINRREVMYANVQAGSRSEMEILAAMQADVGVPVTVALNSPFYDPAYYELVIQVIRDCMTMGINSFIAADPGLILAIEREKIEGIKLHISGEAGEANRFAADLAADCRATRIIFGRKTSIADMRTIIEHGKLRNPERDMEYEAFMLNEMCHFSGGFCCSYHCDEMAPMCHVPYKLSRNDAHRYSHMDARVMEEEAEVSDGYLTGQSGCGLCALWDLMAAGVTNLKVVSRGNYAEDTVRDIQALVRARDCLEKVYNSENAESGKEAFIREMKGAVFAGRCSGNCYYN